jgi:hypothetical protein
MLKIIVSNFEKLYDEKDISFPCNFPPSDSFGLSAGPKTAQPRLTKDLPSVSAGIQNFDEYIKNYDSEFAPAR